MPKMLPRLGRALMGLVGVGAIAAVSLSLISKPPVYPWSQHRALEAHSVADGDNAYLGYVRVARSLHLPNDFAGLERLKGLPAGAAEVKQAVAANTTALAQLHTANQLSGLQSVKRAGLEEAAPLPRGLAQLGWLAGSAARERLDAGQPGGMEAAADGLTLGVRLAYDFDDPLILSLVGIRVQDDMRTRLGPDRSWLPRLTDAELTTFAARLDALSRYQQPVDRMLVGEREVVVEGLLRSADGTPLPSKTPVGRMLTTLGLDKVMMRKAAADTAARFDGQMDGLATRDFAGMQRQAMAYDAWGQSSWRLLAGSAFHPVDTGAYILANLGPSYERTAILLLEAESRLAALRVHVALERYRRAKGALPTQFEQLVPTYLPTVPPDPFKPAQPLGHAGAHLWSVGWDGTDDHGRQPLPPAKQRGAENTHGDLVLD